MKKWEDVQHCIDLCHRADRLDLSAVNKRSVKLTLELMGIVQDTWGDFTLEYCQGLLALGRVHLTEASPGTERELASCLLIGFACWVSDSEEEVMILGAKAWTDFISRMEAALQKAAVTL